MLNVNEYFDGNVKSIGFENTQGRVSAGVMAVGEYEFGTSEPERMLVTTGVLHAQLPGQEGFRAYAAGEEFRIDAGVQFLVRVEEPTAYLCFYGGS